MPPVVALLGIGPGRWWVCLPVPVILLWPLFVLALAVGGLIEAVATRGAPLLTRTLGSALLQLHGMKVDVRSATGSRVFVWLL